ncbi:MAG: hypothetical protein D6692_05405 [Planctomycetota bacterium]|nr:MAG: hypothetical protein D6692_05405 [Planctomycetota bacterium]
MASIFRTPDFPEPPRAVPPPDPIEPDPDRIARLLDERERRNIGTRSLRIDPGLERQPPAFFRDVLG